MMKVKLNRGPMKNQYHMVQDDTAFELKVSMPMEFDKFGPFSARPTEVIRMRQGSYRRSNVTLKNGAVVFEWMGWYE